MYNMTQLKVANTLGKLFIYANDSSGQTFVGMWMIGIFLVALFVLKRWPFIEALTASSFCCFVISAILVYGKYLNFIYALVFLALTAFSGFYLTLQNK